MSPAQQHRVERLGFWWTIKLHRSLSRWGNGIQNTKGDCSRVDKESSNKMEAPTVVLLLMDSRKHEQNVPCTTRETAGKPSTQINTK